MDKDQIISRLNKAVPGTVLDGRRFGRSSQTSIWIELQHLQAVCSAVKNELQMDWLENLSVVEFEGTLVFSYFARSTRTSQSLIVRVSVVLGSELDRVKIPSLLSIWPMGEPMEQEVSDLFGVSFSSAEGELEGEVTLNYLPENWRGFPLRKSYQFPKDFRGIEHTRVPVRSGRRPQ